MDSHPIDEQLQQLRDRIQERTQFHAERYREQLMTRLVADADPDWIMSVLNKQP